MFDVMSSSLAQLLSRKCVFFSSFQKRLQEKIYTLQTNEISQETFVKVETPYCTVNRKALYLAVKQHCTACTTSSVYGTIECLYLKKQQQYFLK